MKKQNNFFPPNIIKYNQTKNLMKLRPKPEDQLKKPRN